MPKALWLLVAAVVLERLVLFRAVVPRQLQQALALRRVALGGQRLRARVRQEVKVEARAGRLVRSHQRHAQHVLVELERLLRVLDADHGVVL